MFLILLSDYNWTFSYDYNLLRLFYGVESSKKQVRDKTSCFQFSFECDASIFQLLSNALIVPTTYDTNNCSIVQMPQFNLKDM